MQFQYPPYLAWCEAAAEAVQTRTSPANGGLSRHHNGSQNAEDSDLMGLLCVEVTHGEEDLTCFKLSERVWNRENIARVPRTGRSKYHEASREPNVEHYGEDVE
jgi:hypothetical protein